MKTRVIVTSIILIFFILSVALIPVFNNSTAPKALTGISVFCFLVVAFFDFKVILECLSKSTMYSVKKLSVKDGWIFRQTRNFFFLKRKLFSYFSQ